MPKGTPSRNTLHSRQAEYEKTLYRKHIRNQYCYMLDRIVLFFGKDRAPEDVFRSDIPLLREHLTKTYGVKTLSSLAWYMRAGRAFYSWMDVMEYVPIGFNPFRVWVPRTHEKKEMDKWTEEMIPS